MVFDKDGLAFLDIGSYTLGEYVPARPVESNLEVVFADEVQATAVVQKLGQLKCGQQLKFPFAQADVMPTKVNIKDSKVLVDADSSTGTKRVVELTLDITELGLYTYAPGDTIAILPSNAPLTVQQLMQRLGIEALADTPCNVRLMLNAAKKVAKVPGHIPASTTPRELLTHCMELNAVLQKQFLSCLASRTSNLNERSFLASLSSKQGSAHYNSLILEGGIRFLDILQLCPSCQPSLALLVEHLPRLFPRPYSIANSPLECTNELRILYSVLPIKPGVTTSMLEALTANKEDALPHIYIYPRLSNKFRYTEEDLESNQILIAIGTGLAPFLGFLAHKQRIRQQCVSLGQTWLYAGAKTPQAIPKHDELLGWQESAVLQRLRLCHSQVDIDNGTSKYVQELLKADAKELVDLLVLPTTVLYVCADGMKVSKSINDALQECLVEALQVDKTQAVEKLQSWRELGKYREDLWV